jgi:A/G-specific adenine glycosylase
MAWQPVLTTIRAKLRAWFQANGRELPWRKTRNPYQILVSEVMLQQTQVERVIPKYLAFLDAFPSVEALAEAPTAEVIRLWAGLGYNRRAVNLQRAARAVVEQHAGIFPSELAAIRALPGVGPYTSGAVACFAFEQPVAFMDTNIRRVVRRLFVGPDEAAGASEAQLLELAQRALDPVDPWVWNQAIMELGALICRADAPACWRCPLREECLAYTARRAADEQLFSYPPPAPEARPRRRAAERREAPYAGSNRFYRGRLVDALRGAPAEGAPLAALGPLVRPEGFGPDELPWLRGVAEGLARDGLLVLAERDGEPWVRLP